MRLKPQALPLHAALGACEHSGEPQGTGRYEVDAAGSKGGADDVGQPAQPAQGIHAASLLVSTARSSCGGGVPRRVRTTYVGVCSSCRPDAMGAYARARPRAASESRYSSRDAHATPGLPEPRPRRRRRPGPSGEQGPNACDTCSVFPASGGVAGHDELELELECDAAAPPATTSSKGK